jgi:hypothetical protein
MPQRYDSHPVGLRRLPVRRHRERERLRDVDDDRPVRPSAVVVLVDVDDGVVAEDVTDLLDELPQRPVGHGDEPVP